MKSGSAILGSHSEAIGITEKSNMKIAKILNIFKKKYLNV